MLNGSLLISWAYDYPLPFTCNTYKAMEGIEPPPSSLETGRRTHIKQTMDMFICMWREIVVGESLCVSSEVGFLCAKSRLRNSTLRHGLVSTLWASFQTLGYATSLVAERCVLSYSWRPKECLVDESSYRILVVALATLASRYNQCRLRRLKGLDYILQCHIWL